MQRRVKVLAWISAALVIALGIDYNLAKTRCTRLSDQEVVAILEPAYSHMKDRSRHEDVADLRFVPVVHHETLYPSGDPDGSVWVALVRAPTGSVVYHMHLFGDCSIETWGN